MYHAESRQEDFLVLAGECLLVIEEEERRIRAWDFVHCPPVTRHVFVGIGEEPCVVFMTGARPEGRSIVYPRSDAARAHGAGVEAETASPAEVRAVPRLATRPAGRLGAASLGGRLAPVPAPV